MNKTLRYWKLSLIAECLAFISVILYPSLTTLSLELLAFLFFITFTIKMFKS